MPFPVVPEIVPRSAVAEVFVGAGSSFLPGGSIPIGECGGPAPVIQYAVGKSVQKRRSASETPEHTAGGAVFGAESEPRAQCGFLLFHDQNFLSAAQQVPEIASGGKKAGFIAEGAASENDQIESGEILVEHQKAIGNAEFVQKSCGLEFRVDQGNAA